MRDKAVLKTTSGTRRCNCKTKVVTRQLGPGMYQQFQTQVGVEWGACGRKGQARIDWTLVRVRWA